MCTWTRFDCVTETTIYFHESLELEFQENRDVVLFLYRIGFTLLEWFICINNHKGKYINVI